MAETFLSPVIEKLLDLLIDEAKSLIGVSRDVKSLQEELEIIQPFLRDAEIKSSRGKLNEASKIWLKQLREESERIEDVVDEYFYHVQQRRHGRGFVQSVRKAGRFIKALNSRHDLASEIGDIKQSLREIKDRGQSYGLRPFEQGESSKAVSVDPRIGSLFVDEDELVGIDSMSKELVQCLVEGSSRRSVISLVGEGGIGKKTLARKVYNDVEAKGHFDCHVWITVSQSCDIDMILKIMKNKVSPTTDQPVSIEDLVALLRTSLMAKRYLIVFDDVWQTDFWEFIKNALPNKENGSRLILTTRNAAVVESFQESSNDIVKKLKTWSEGQAWELFCQKAFRCSPSNRCCPDDLKQLALKILSKCQGLPLAIAAIAGLLSKKEKSKVEWQKVLDYISYELEENCKLSNISKILLLSYYDLPYHLRLCFLYFSIFPEDYSLYDESLCRLWIAEGFVKSRSDDISLEQIAKGYLNELIDRNIVSFEVEFGSGRSCRVHDLFRDLSLTRIDDCGFCHVFKENKLRCNAKSRRLSSYGDIKNALKVVTDSKLRSIFLFNTGDISSDLLIGLFKNFKLIKVLCFRFVPLHNLPKEVGNLFNLTYLDLSGTNVEMLPKSIGKLHNLQILDLRFTLVRELPIEINKLRKLRQLCACSFDEESEYKVTTFGGVKIYEGISRLVELQCLGAVDAHSSGMGILKELHMLRKLRYFGITKVTAEMGKFLRNTIDKMNLLEELEITAINMNEVLDFDGVLSPPTLLVCLVMVCGLRAMPSWISKLQNLQTLGLLFSRMSENPLNYIKDLPKLAHLNLYDSYDGEELHFDECSFGKLKHLQIINLKGLKSLKIERGALPLLQKLEFGSFPLMKDMPSDIQHLHNLKSLIIKEMPREFVISLQPNGGTQHWKIKHIPLVEFGYYTGRGNKYHGYTLGSTRLMQHLQQEDN